MGVVRILLALSVLADHCGPILIFKLVDSHVAVESFYMISGFYMSLIINEKYVNKNNSFKLFITNRFLRLYPIYWVVLLLTVFTCLGNAMISNGQVIPKFDSYLSVEPNIFSFSFLILTNILIFGQDLVMFLGINPDNGNLFFTENFRNTSLPLHSFLFVPQSWTLGLELTFYLFAPLLLKRKLGTILLVIFGSFVIRVFIFYYLGFQHDPWSYRFFPSEIMFFLLGHLSYKIYLKTRESKLNKTLYIYVYLLIIFFTISYPHLPTFEMSHLPFSLKELAYFFIMILALPVLFNFSRKSKFDSQIGDLSYPIYVSHILIGTICYSLPVELFKSGLSVALITIAFSYFLNKLIASPIEKYRQSRLAI